MLIEGSRVGNILIEEDYSKRFENILKAGDPYEPALHTELERRLQEGDVFFDVGARFGYFGMLAESLGCSVVSFEKDEKFISYLRRNTDSEIVIGTVGEEISLDSFIDYRPSILLIDVEGDEIKALASATDLLEDLTPVVFIEIHPWELNESDYYFIEGLLEDFSLSWSSHRTGGDWSPGIGEESDSPTYMLMAEK